MLLSAVDLPAAGHKADNVGVTVVLGIFPNLSFDAPHTIKTRLLVVRVH